MTTLPRAARLLATPALAAALAACGMPEGPRAPQMLDLPRATKVSVRNVSPGVDPASMAGQPVTIYRLGERYGRVEYSPDPETGSQLLVVVREPHAWVADLGAGQVRYGRDEGPSYVFRAPVLRAEAEEVPEALRWLEFGKELEFVQRHEADVRSVQRPDGSTVREHRVDLDDFTLVLVSRPNGTPLELGIFQAGELRHAYRYLDYRTDLLPTNAMFALPDGLELVAGPEGEAGPTPEEGGGPEMLPSQLPEPGEPAPEADAPPAGE